MSTALYRQLLSQARRLASFEAHRPKEANLRRAVSSAYYAMYHYLGDRTTRAIIGTKNEHRMFRHALARGLNHGTMKRACEAIHGSGKFGKGFGGALANVPVPKAIQDMARMFVSAQEKRHYADYDLSRKFRRSDVMVFITEIERTIKNYEPLERTVEGKCFLGCLMLWTTRGN